MAHIFEIATLVSRGPSYVNGRKVEDQVEFPDTEVFRGFNQPCRLEADIFDLEVQDHRFPPMFEDDIHFNGDGNITSIRIQNGHVDYKQRYVRTDRFLSETKARKNLFGKYRNPFTDSDTVRGIIRTTANTNIIFWRGVLLAMKEDGPPYALDPLTLRTIGRYDFDGQIQSPTFTAHPKFDPKTGEMICFGYEAGGNGNDGSCDIVVYTIDKYGHKTEEVWYQAPFCGMIHDCGISENYIVFPMTPLKCSLSRMQEGGNHWAWDPEESQWYGIVPRRGGKPSDIVWLRSDNAFHGHVVGCYEENDRIVFDLTIADGNVFFFFPPENAPPGQLAKRNKLRSPTYRWIFNPHTPSGSYVTPEIVWDTSGEFSRIDDRYVTARYNHFWQAKVDPTREYDAARCGSPAGGLFNCLAHYTWDQRTEDIYWAGPRATFQEPTFIPRQNGAEGEGWIVALLNHLDVLRNDVAIFDALKVSNGPIATVHLPMKLRLGLHGNFVDHRDIDDWYARREPGGDLGAVKPAATPLPWQREAFKESLERTQL